MFQKGKNAHLQGEGEMGEGAVPGRGGQHRGGAHAIQGHPHAWRFHRIDPVTYHFPGSFHSLLSPVRYRYRYLVTYLSIRLILNFKYEHPKGNSR